MKEILDHRDWWKQLEPQWREAFGLSALKHSKTPNLLELDMLYNMQTLRLVGPTAPFPNMQFELTNLNGIQHLRNITTLVITHHKIVHIELLSNLLRLKSLFLFNNCITSLEGIESLTELEQLYVQCNQITSIKPIEQLTNLREVYISDNRIASLDGLTEKHSDKLTRFICRPNEQLKQKEIIRIERELGIICR